MEYKKKNRRQTVRRKIRGVWSCIDSRPEGCGKTTTAKQKAKSIIEFQDEDTRENILPVANTTPSKLLKGEKPILFDEWQDAPKI